MAYIDEKARLFHDDSLRRVELASDLGVRLTDYAFKFFSKDYGLYSLTYPFYFIEKIIFSGFRLIYGSYLLFNAVFISPTTAAPEIVLGMAYELGSMLLNAINVALAIISLFTKTFGIFNSNNHIDSEIEDETHAAITELTC